MKKFFTACCVIVTIAILPLSTALAGQLYPVATMPQPLLPQSTATTLPQPIVTATPQPIVPASQVVLPPAAAADQAGQPGISPASPEGRAPLVLPPMTIPSGGPSFLEKALSAEVFYIGSQQLQPTVDKLLPQFGYSFFNPMEQGFAALTDVPVTSDYVIAPGDTIIVSIWGSFEGTLPLEVNRSGEITLPRVGAVNVWGVPFGKLQELLRGKLGEIFKDFQLNVTMGKLHLVKVFVVGEVKAPGAYNVTALATVINGLAAAGGPLKSGSLRNIQVKRGGKVVETVDLYEFFLKGDKSRDIRLQSGDTIYVPVIGRVAGVAGNVKRPAIYELKDETTLKDLLALADGVLSTGYLQRLQISRVEAHDRKVVTDFNLGKDDLEKTLAEKAAAIPVQDMDLVKIFPIDQTLRNYVRLEGYVRRTGDYALRPGMRMSDLLPADNILPEYYGEAAELTRLFPPDYHPGKIIFSPAKSLAHEAGQDLELQEFDTVRIFSRWEMEEMPTVRISGEVQRPGKFRLFADMKVRDLVVLGGNPKMSAYLKNAEIHRVKMNGESVNAVSETINLEEALKGNAEQNLTLAPFDELIVRKIPNWEEETDRYVALTGEVLFPGVYPISKGEKLSAAIERAGGFTAKAYLRGAKFTRRSVQLEQQKRLEEVIARAEADIQKKQAELAELASSKEELESAKAAMDGLTKSLQKLKLAKAEGRIIIQLDSLAGLKESPYDMELMGGDVLDIPITPSSVNVMGQVYSPSSALYLPGKTVSYYLAKAGGMTQDAESNEIYVLRADGSVLSSQQSSFGLHWDDYAKKWSFGGFMSTPLEPGDTLVVPQELERIAWMRSIKDITTILSQAAITAGVLIAAGL